MGWTPKQTMLFHRACAAAGWNDHQRYMAMRYAGCPVDQATARPSVKSGRNSQRSFELVMALAESCAAIKGERVPTASGGKSWSEMVQASLGREQRLARSIYAEARARMPGKFAEGGLDGFVARMTRLEPREFNPVGERELKDCDGMQVYRIVEGLKAWVAREFIEMGIEPTTFELTRWQRDRMHQRREELKRRTG